MICWVRIAQRVGYELIESGYETSELGYESSGYERSMGTKRLDTLVCILPVALVKSVCSLSILFVSLFVNINLEELIE